MNLSNRNIAYFLLISIFLISGCGSSTGSATEDTSKNTPATEASSTTATAPTETTPTETTPTETASTTETAPTATPTTNTTTNTTTTTPIETPSTTETTPTATPTTNTTSNPNVTIEPSNNTVHSGQVKDSNTGNGLANVKVSLGDLTTITDENGFYTFSNLTESKEAVINFEKEGYVLGSTKIQLKSLCEDSTVSTNYLEFTIDKYNSYWTDDSQKRRTGAHIDIPASVYTDTEGNLYTGAVTSLLKVRDVTTNEGKTFFTGSFEGKNTNGEIVPFVSYGFISLIFKDANGNALNIIKDSGATLTFDAVPSLEQQDIIPLWYYDNVQGIWIEEGYAELQSNGTYKGDISHSGTWSLNKPIEEEVGIYRGSIVDKNGAPMSEVRVKAIGDNWISSDLSTDENGVFEIKVIPGSSFKLSAYDYKDKYGANYNGTIPAIASGEIVEE